MVNLSIYPRQGDRKKYKNVSVDNEVKQVNGFFFKFVEEAPSLYGETFNSLNIHILIHHCDDIIYTK